MTASGPRKLPARAHGLVSRDMGDECVVVDEATQQAHALSGLAAAIWRATDGGPYPEVDQGEIDGAVDRMVEIGLLQAPSSLSRRQVLARTGKVAALTAITTIALPEVAAHASTITSGTLVGQNKTLTIPAGAKRVSITLVGASGGNGAAGTGQTPAAGALGGMVVWAPGDSYTATNAISLNYSTGAAGAAAAGRTPGAGGVGFHAGASGGGKEAGEGSPVVVAGGAPASPITSAGGVVIEAGGRRRGRRREQRSRQRRRRGCRRHERTVIVGKRLERV